MPHMTPAREVGGDFYDFFLLDTGSPGVRDRRRLRQRCSWQRSSWRSAAPCCEPRRCRASRRRVPEIRERCWSGKATRPCSSLYSTAYSTRTPAKWNMHRGPQPAYRLMQSGQFDVLAEPASMIVGALENATFETGHLRLRPGECIVLYTDGVIEATNVSQVEFSETRLQSLLERRRDALCRWHRPQRHHRRSPHLFEPVFPSPTTSPASSSASSEPDGGT